MGCIVIAIGEREERPAMASPGEGFGSVVNKIVSVAAIIAEGVDVGSDLNLLAFGDSFRSVRLKVAVSVIGPFIVTEAGLVVPVNEPEPTPVQLLKVNPCFALAWIETCFPRFCQPLTGFTWPPCEAFIVRKY
jgi:hypothetical protein